MDKPTLKEVKEYFKNAKEVRSMHFENITFEFDIESISELDKGFQYFIIDKNGDSRNLYFQGKYAEIISYKEPLYQLTAKEVVHAYENPQWLKDTFKECFETELEVGKYNLIDCGQFKYKFFIEKIEKNVIYGYGFDEKDIYYESSDLCNVNDVLSHRLLTESEIKEALVKEAIKIGLTPENLKYIKCLVGFSEDLNQRYYKTDAKFHFEPHLNKLWLMDGSYLSICIFQNGTWAEILPTYTIPEAESKFNIKIVDKNV